MRSKTIELFLAIGLAATLAACNQAGEPEGGEEIETAPPATEAPLEESPAGALEESPAGALEESPAEGGEGGEGGEGN